MRLLVLMLVWCGDAACAVLLVCCCCCWYGAMLLLVRCGYITLYYQITFKGAVVVRCGAAAAPGGLLPVQSGDAACAVLLV